jgi:hypothetical protein
MADLNDLQREWDAQPGYPEAKMRAIAELVRARSGAMRSRLFARDRGEAIAGLFIIVSFASYWLFAEQLKLGINAIAKTGIAIMIAGAVEIIVLMQIVQRRARADFTSVPLKEFLLSEVQMLNRQIALLRHVAWWYLLPLLAGGWLFAIGIGFTWPGGKIFAIVFCVSDFVFCAFCWWLNQNARKKSLEPLRNALQRTCDGLSALDSESAGAKDELRDVLVNPALDAQCRRYVRFVRPAWHQIVVAVFACLGGVFAGVLIQQYFGQPLRFEEWPLVGLLVAAVVAVGSTCVRRIGKEESRDQG